MTRPRLDVTLAGWALFLALFCTTAASAWRFLADLFALLGLAAAFVVAFGWAPMLDAMVRAAG